MVTKRIVYQSDDKLRGMDEICLHVGFSESTVLQFIRYDGLPARKTRGVWLSSKRQIDAWWEKHVEGGNGNGAA